MKVKIKTVLKKEQIERILSLMREEYEGYYGKYPKNYDFTISIPFRMDVGFTCWENIQVAGWCSSAGNMFYMEYYPYACSNESMHVNIVFQGRRHGVLQLFRFIPEDVMKELKRDWIKEYETERRDVPWWFTTDMTELPEYQEELNEWKKWKMPKLP